MDAKEIKALYEKYGGFINNFKNGLSLKIEI